MFPIILIVIGLVFMLACRWTGRFAGSLSINQKLWGFNEQYLSTFMIASHFVAGLSFTLVGVAMLAGWIHY